MQAPKKEQPTRLRDLIKAVRACKTAAEERAVVAQESAEIRESFRDETYRFRHRSVAKLLFIQMMGYPTNFGQVECLKLIASSNYTEKRVGYLGLTQLLNEKDDVLMMVTNSMQIDMNSSNTQIIGMALTALANIATAEMCRDLSKDVCKLMSHNNSYIRKRATIAGARIVRKCPDLIEDFQGEVPKVLEDRSHVVVMNGVNLLLEIIKIQPNIKQAFVQYSGLVVRAMRNLIHTVHSPEHTIGGVTDPFLQVSLIKLMSKIAGAEPSEEMTDCLAQVATNTEPAKNAGNAVLYECVRTIMDISSTSGLRVLATNIMGRFLLNRDNNLRYVALNSLLKLVKVDLLAVQRHKTTIIDCLKDADIAIRKKALELTYCLINESNVKQIVKEMIDFLIAAEPEFKEALVTKLCLAIELHSPTKQWHFDSVLRVLTLAGSYVPEEVVASTAHIISSTPELQSYAVHKLFNALVDNTEQQGLVLLALWSIGEFGNFLVSETLKTSDGELKAMTPNEIIQGVEKTMTPIAADICKEYALTALIKLSVRIPQAVQSIRRLIEQQISALNVELQQRACEYIQLLGSNWDSIRGPLLEKMPIYAKAPAVDIPTTDSSSPVLEKPKTPTQPNSAQNLLDIETLIFDSQPIQQSQIQQSTEVPQPQFESLLDLFSSTPQPSFPAPVLNPVTGDISEPDKFEDFVEITPIKHNFIAFEDEEINVDFNCTKPEPDALENTQISVIVSNKCSKDIVGFKLSAAVLKHLEFSFSSAASTSMMPGGSIQMQMKMKNKAQGQKPIAIRMKIDYTIDSVPRSKLSTVDSFPPNY
ncbi:unnamed protein product [Blepharisma stoltei]|uniref:AP-1 complex subunit gamma n=1 Tax=Blepharisma stoltei TaxID=1481888 RepID=A0AAU9JX30_9CILI|nr:unnamed protein product [Blepharisma stoltei]